MVDAQSITHNAVEVVLAQPRGFCAGVDRAIEIVERALTIHGRPIYVRHEIVHNRFVVEDLRDKGAVFVKELDEVPEGGIVVFSAHGVSQAIRKDAESRGLRVFDATCPLVTKVHIEVSKMRAANLEVIMVGHAGHPEVEGTLGQAQDGMYLVETVDDVRQLVVKDASKLALRLRFPSIVEPKKGDICYATQNRQDAVKMMAPQSDLVLVIGSANSSNSNRLREVAERLNIPAFLIDGPDAIDPAWLVDRKRIGITAGASAPEVLVQSVIDYLKTIGAVSVRQMDGQVEHVSFPLPRGLSDKKTD
jgi:4-hydroxy-3-methylbut-2-enyl diphosphate reductase